MLNWQDEIGAINEVRNILDELSISPVSENQEQIREVIKDYLEQEYPEMYNDFDINDILGEVIEDE